MHAYIYIYIHIHQYMTVYAYVYVYVYVYIISIYTQLTDYKLDKWDKPGGLTRHGYWPGAKCHCRDLLLDRQSVKREQILRRRFAVMVGGPRTDSFLGMGRVRIG